MGRTRSRDRSKKFSILDEEDHAAEAAEAELPKDEAGRRKIKRQYQELLGIRIEKLKGRILNRERINKTIEGVYFICVSCKKICHNIDDGLVEDPDNASNMCSACAKGSEKSKPKGRGKRKGASAA